MNGQSDGGLRGLGKEQDVKEAKGRQGVWAELEEGQSRGGLMWEALHTSQRAPGSWGQRTERGRFWRQAKS